MKPRLAPVTRASGQSSVEALVVGVAFAAALAWWPGGPLERLVAGLDAYLQRYTHAVARP